VQQYVIVLTFDWYWYVFTLVEAFVGDEAAPSNDSMWSMDCSTVLRVITLHISSPILAAKSPFFYKVRGLNLVLQLLFLGYFNSYWVHAYCSCFQTA
jgi:hypothetical protein